MDKSTSGKIAKQPGRLWPWIVTALVLLAGVIGYLVTAEESIDVSQSEKPLELQLVTIETVDVGSESGEVCSYANVRPRWAAELRTAVSGKVLNVLQGSLSGEQVVAGEVLIRIEDSLYLANLVAAELSLEEAKLALRKARVRTAVARQEYQHTGSKPLNDLALHLPELNIAKKQVQSAESRVAVARKDLEDTIIRAPFSAFVTERYVSPGQSVNVGDRLLKLADDTVFELMTELGRKDWTLIPQPFAGRSVKVLNQEGEQIGQATVRQGGGFLDPQTRQHKIFLEIKATETQPILAGEFVEVVFPGVTVDKALNIPASAVSRNGYLWFVDADSRLQRLVPKVLFQRQERMVIAAPEGSDLWKVVVTPLASFLPGQKVHPREQGD